jgi:RNA polymerase sigma-70 factor, ECF subfamily
VIGRIAVGDGHAMRALYVRHNVRVFRFLSCKVKERTIAEDVVSEVFVEVWQSAHRFGARAGVPAWLLAIAYCKAIAPRFRSFEGFARIVQSPPYSNVGV